MVTRRRTVASTIVLAFIALFAFGTGSASAYPPGHAPTLALSVSTAGEGSTIGVQGSNYAANETVTLTLHSAVSTLGTAHTDGNGSFSTTVTLPNGVTGQHTVVGTGATGDSASAAILITAAGTSGAGSGGGLSNTGVAVLSIGGLGVLLLLGGGIMLLAGRRSKAVA